MSVYNKAMQAFLESPKTGAGIDFSKLQRITKFTRMKRPRNIGAIKMLKRRYNHVLLIITKNIFANDVLVVKKIHKHKPIKHRDFVNADFIIDTKKSTKISRFGGFYPTEVKIDQKDINAIIFETGDVEGYKKYCKMTRQPTSDEFIKDMIDAQLLDKIN